MSGRSDPRCEDIVYRATPAGPLLARVYVPSDPTPRARPRAAVVSVHGGRWVSQSRLTNAMIDTALAEAGIVVMALDFRMPPDAMYPEPVADIHFAIRWLKANAARYGASPSLVGGIGTSSGGHQLMLNAMRPRDPRYAALTHSDPSLTANLAFAVAAWPVLDPLARYRMAMEKNMERHIQSHDAYWPNEDAMDEGNPQRMLDRGEALHRPPLLLIQGLDDKIVPPAMTQRFADSYRASGGEATLLAYDGEGHTFITKQPDSLHAQQAIAAIRDFVLCMADRLSADASPTAPPPCY